jgi:hypothetical protein
MVGDEEARKNVVDDRELDRMSTHPSERDGRSD